MSRNTSDPNSLPDLEDLISTVASNESSAISSLKMKLAKLCVEFEGSVGGSSSAARGNDSEREEGFGGRIVKVERY